MNSVPGVMQLESNLREDRERTHRERERERERETLSHG